MTSERRISQHRAEVRLICWYLVGRRVDPGETEGTFEAHRDGTPNAGGAEASAGVLQSG